MNIYVAYRLYHTFGASLPSPWALFSVWLFLDVAGMLFRTDGTIIPNAFTDYLYLAGAYWMAIIYYAFLLTLLCDTVNFLQKKLGLAIFQQPAKITAYCIMLFCVASIGYGAYNAGIPRPTYYNLAIDKAAKTAKMRIVLLSDIHFGKIVDKAMAEKFVAEINRQQPDIVIFAGDIIDNELQPVKRKSPMGSFKNIKSKYGVYGIMGNHDYFNRNAPEVISYFEDQGINMLVDQAVELPNGVVLYGRDDYSQTAGKKDLAENLAAYHGKPILVADHQPRRIKETAAAGADVLMSGHTHKGQFIPNNFITRYIYDLDYGYKQFGNLHMIVTSGIGSWGPPVRIGSDAEVVVMTLSFAAVQ